VLRRSHDSKLGKNAINIVSAWATDQHLVLAQRKVEGKSNEITAIPKLLEILDLHGCIVTIDAMGTQTTIAEQIVSQGGDYILALKANQGQLWEDVRGLFRGLEATNGKAYPHETAQTTDKGHGRVEQRICQVISDPAILQNLRGNERWECLQSVVWIKSRRTHTDGEEETQDRYYISSTKGASRILKGVRSHWGVENQLHWILDVGFDEDQSRVRKGHGAENFATLRHFALNLLRLDKSKGSIRVKRFKAALQPNFLKKLLFGASAPS
jgi:predicted transposase YbfD/YdcC